MTAKDIRGYKHLPKLIAICRMKVDELNARDAVLRDSVRGSNPDFPFQERSFGIAASREYMGIPKSEELIRAEEDLAHYEGVKAEIDTLRLLITDATDKLILELMLQGKSQEYIADTTGMSQSTVSRKIQQMCEKTQ